MPSARRRSRTAAPEPRSLRRFLRFAAWIGLLLAATTPLALVEQLNVSPRILAGYVERRAYGHGGLIEAGAGEIAELLRRADRGAPMPRLDRPAPAGARSTKPSDLAPPAGGRSIVAATSADLVAALEKAEPGDVITLAPGTYRFDGRSLQANRAGRANAPITVRAVALGTAKLEFSILEGFHVTGPYWQFENLVIRGVCARHDDCEHAFHVVGAARSTVIRNNDLRDFNAHIKINGDARAFPDAGRVERNTLANTAPRETGLPVTPVDMVAASGWTIEHNLIYDFIKAGGDVTSYGAFAKGGGSDNAFIANVVVCEHRFAGAPGRRIGLSFGGGGSDAPSCRDRRCVVEHDNGLMRDNLIASCSDDGIYLNRAARSTLLHNSLLDTAGIEARFPESNGLARANLVDGPLRLRDGGSLDDADNRIAALLPSYVGVHPARHLFLDAAALDLRWSGDPPRADESIDAGRDLCGTSRPARSVYGAFEDFEPCLKHGAD